MHENEIKLIVETVVRVLAEQGLLKKSSSAGCGCAPGASPAGGGVKVTVGTAGKVFSGDWSPSRIGGNAARGSSPLAQSPKRLSAEGMAPQQSEADHTYSTDCPHCRALGQLNSSDLRDMGADRIGVCHPTKNCNEISSRVDHTLLKPGATQEEIGRLCADAKDYCFASVCVNPSYVALASRLLRGSGVKVCTVVGFPLGSTTPTVKALESRDAIANGAEEIDMVINVGALKSGNDALVRDDIRAVREATRGKVLKVIIETSLLSDDEKVRACRMSKEVGADFVKTSTGFGPGGATAEDVKLMRDTVGPTMGVKASGGIRDTEMARKMIAAGATRLGTSASVAIVTDAKPSGGKGY